MSKRATLVVDLQNEYLPTGQLPLTGIDAALGNAARVMAAARAQGQRVIHIRHESAKPGAPLFAPGTDAVQIVPQVAPIEGEPVVVKNHPNSFRDTGLKQLLDAEGIEQLVVIGAMSHMCVEATTRAAADLGYPVTVVHDACATLPLEFGSTQVPAAQVHATAMAALAFGYATVTTTDAHLA